MLIFPAIDLKNGRCVRLYQGQFEQETVVNENPLQQALRFEQLGAKVIHLVDLDGALDGTPTNLPVIEQIAKTLRIPVQVGGGIRSLETIATLLSVGVDRVIIGTAALLDPAFLRAALAAYGEKIVVGIDAKEEYVATRGWLDVSDVHYITLAKQMEEMGVKTIVFTDISRDGTLAGPNFEQLASLQSAVAVNIVASGGVSSLADIEKLNRMNLYGVITGKALYDGKVVLEEALEAVKTC
ncbi:1-(5-phosphoribosyl)-5-[(5-phosphoribosylamino)methylideneamino]imidazole-4-carboxamide isomerase [Ectobacillus antri]|uniref:1-(5-phosphoribosyl)-5-[(5-phosphoribosylamino)methylideneamino] imidazole-4-carboxamide isomerase n=1 Tax=Ectobacillus antri TaxID=2486280 RepID=A0ABT6H6Y4_9BACI|nr:1-(5-phosphoribosyl)-5-[(5-phosphoribosylamino)methylideneamino]imidazole-4-carboxamide isomerase [Ectobacillus antri]MDG4656877.1 1-(5-phosphoribosyl)-5-[(5-phosphoribosylamino)methylideneamino]imidazole-4-carboxamide isomerase [Ectobacillus antri]MDG5754226.1 1-(5-phosphoribosyl)-5-[(5-phosphoribosylamino)methylideneamino]imidazole-4-carboxamide isomerase [Ectobacillus antri]